eukprot:scpid26718/ scgid5007/ 
MLYCCILCVFVLNIACRIVHIEMQDPFLYFVDNLKRERGYFILPFDPHIIACQDHKDGGALVAHYVLLTQHRFAEHVLYGCSCTMAVAQAQRLDALSGDGTATSAFLKEEEKLYCWHAKAIDKLVSSIVSEASPPDCRVVIVRTSPLLGCVAAGVRTMNCRFLLCFARGVAFIVKPLLFTNSSVRLILRSSANCYVLLLLLHQTGYGIVAIRRSRTACLVCHAFVHACKHVKAFKEWQHDQAIEPEEDGDCEGGDTEPMGPACISSEKIPYPLTSELKEKFLGYKDGRSKRPFLLVPSLGGSCANGFSWSESDPVQQGWLVSNCRLVTIGAVLQFGYNDKREQQKCAVYFTQCTGPCACRKTYDGQVDGYLNVNNKYAVDYELLMLQLHLFLEGRSPLATTHRYVSPMDCIVYIVGRCKI